MTAAAPAESTRGAGDRDPHRLLRQGLARPDRPRLDDQPLNAGAAPGGNPDRGGAPGRIGRVGGETAFRSPDDAGDRDEQRLRPRLGADADDQPSPAAAG